MIMFTWRTMPNSSGSWKSTTSAPAAFSCCAAASIAACIAGSVSSG
jgi:hypothetical protein